MTTSIELGKYAVLALAGAGGAFIRSLVVNKGSVLLWRRWKKENEDGSITRGVDLGIISSLVIGAMVGVMVDQSPTTAFSWAISGSYLFEEIMKREMSNPIPPKVMGGGGL